jgi:DNA-binding response OmpR family regulator
MLPMASEKFLTGKKILIGIGTKPVRDIVLNMCRDRGATPIRFGNGEEVILRLEGFLPDLAFTEFHMSPLDGVSFCRAIRDKLKSPIPIIMLVSVHDEDGVVKSRQAGATVTVSMPFSFNDILAATKKAIEHGTVTPPTGLRFGPRPQGDI